MSVEVTKLPSGLTVVTDTMPHLENRGALGSGRGSAAGMRKPNEHGISHLLEHMAFKGTARRSSREIVEEIEAVRRRSQCRHLDRDHGLLRARE